MTNLPLGENSLIPCVSLEGQKLTKCLKYSRVLISDYYFLYIKQCHSKRSGAQRLYNYENFNCTIEIEVNAI